MHLKQFDLLIIMLTAIMNIIWALLPSHLPLVSVILAMPLVFLLPGYALTEVIFQKQSRDGIYRYQFVLSLGLSLVIDILSGFVLNMFPLGLRSISWAVCLSVIVVALSLLAAYRRRGSLTNRIRLPRFQFSIRKYMLLALSLIVALVIIVLSLRFSATSVAQQPNPAFTQLWMLPPNQANDTCSVRLGIQSFEVIPVAYRVTMTVNNMQVRTWSSVVLTPQQKWERLVLIPPLSRGIAYIDLLLYRSDKPKNVYREVHMTLAISEEAKGGKAIKNTEIRSCLVL